MHPPFVCHGYVLTRSGIDLRISLHRHARGLHAPHSESVLRKTCSASFDLSVTQSLQEEEDMRKLVSTELRDSCVRQRPLLCSSASTSSWSWFVNTSRCNSNAEPGRFESHTLHEANVQGTSSEAVQATSRPLSIHFGNLRTFDACVNDLHSV